MDSLTVARVVAVGATILCVLIGMALFLAIMGALFAPALSACLAALAATWTAWHGAKVYPPRHGYNKRQAASEGIVKAGRVYRLTGRGWEIAS